MAAPRGTGRGRGVAGLAEAGASRGWPRLVAARREAVAACRGARLVAARREAVAACRRVPSGRDGGDLRGALRGRALRGERAGEEAGVEEAVAGVVDEGRRRPLLRGRAAATWFLTGIGRGERAGRGEMRARGCDPCGSGSDARRGGVFSGEFSPAHLRSSIRASLSGRAEGCFSGELGTAHMSRADLPNVQIAKNLSWAENCWVGPTYQTHP
jgi:hypothetical protein